MTTGEFFIPVLIHQLNHPLEKPMKILISHRYSLIGINGMGIEKTFRIWPKNPTSRVTSAPNMWRWNTCRKFPGGFFFRGNCGGGQFKEGDIHGLSPCCRMRPTLHQRKFVMCQRKAPGIGDGCPISTSHAKECLLFLKNASEPWTLSLSHSTCWFITVYRYRYISMKWENHPPINQLV